jgi:hypothetical protein
MLLMTFSGRSINECTVMAVFHSNNSTWFVSPCLWKENSLFSIRKTIGRRNRRLIPIFSSEHNKSGPPHPASAERKKWRENPKHLDLCIERAMVAAEPPPVVPAMKRHGPDPQARPTTVGAVCIRTVLISFLVAVLVVLLAMQKKGTCACSG